MRHNLKLGISEFRCVALPLLELSSQPVALKFPLVSFSRSRIEDSTGVEGAP